MLERKPTATKALKNKSVSGQRSQKIGGFTLFIHLIVFGCQSELQGSEMMVEFYILCVSFYLCVS